MKYLVYSVRDIKVNAYMQPFVLPNDATAIRAFGDSVAKGDNPMAQHASDYELCRVGIWEDEKGKIVGTDPVQIAIASDFVIKKGD